MGSTPSRHPPLPGSTNHSHVCGINRRSFVHCLLQNESFPRMWDQHAFTTVDMRGVRIIPTYVGSTVDHYKIKKQYPRIIPTYVGSTDIRHTVHIGTANHSHVCGINYLENEYGQQWDESFPRMWDQHRHFSLPCHSFRIIPTYVGSTLRLEPSFNVPPNHSHVCGINFNGCSTGYRIIESFPRMWDQLKCPHALCSSGRIIPTYVGSTSFHQSSLVMILESFPRMWDQLGYRAASAFCGRIIPTYVGSTWNDDGTLSIILNHSHVCGIN